MLQSLEDAAEDYTLVDWGLHQRLTILSGNPVFTLILNGRPPGVRTGDQAFPVTPASAGGGG